MWLLPRIRLALARRPWLYWLVVAACTGIVWLQWSDVSRSADRAARRWGDTALVAVAVRAARPGEILQVQVRTYPIAMIPSGALSEVAETSVAARLVAAGEMLVAADVVSDATPPAHWVVLALPVHDTPSFVSGQRAAVFAGGTRVCDGTIADVTGEHVEIALPPECAASISVTIGAGDVVLARLP